MLRRKKCKCSKCCSCRRSKKSDTENDIEMPSTSGLASVAFVNESDRVNVELVSLSESDEIENLFSFHARKRACCDKKD